MDKNSQSILEKPGTIKILWILLYAVCGLTVVAEFFIERHSYFAIDNFFGFYAVLGFACCAVLIIAAKGIGFILKRKEDYYNG
jgi:hypothetical protein